jgi:hypothetical protein
MDLELFQEMSRSNFLSGRSSLRMFWDRSVWMSVGFENKYSRPTDLADRRHGKSRLPYPCRVWCRLATDRTRAERPITFCANCNSACVVSCTHWCVELTCRSRASTSIRQRPSRATSSGATTIRSTTSNPPTSCKPNAAGSSSHSCTGLGRGEGRRVFHFV